MPELETLEKAPEKVMVTDSFIHENRKRKMAKEEEELRKLEEEALKGEPVGDPVPTEDPNTDDPEKKEEGGEKEVLTKEEETFKKRYGDLRRHLQKIQDEHKTEIEKLKSDPSSVRPPASDEDLDTWAKQYPQVASIVETIAAKKAKELFAKAEHKLEEYEVAQAETTRTKAENKIRKVHGDFDDISKDDAFHDWAEVQPKWVQDAVYENADDPASVIRVLDLYKMDKGLTPAVSKEAAKNAALATGKGTKSSVDVSSEKGVWKESDVNKMSQAEYEKVADKIDQAMMDGKFVYDMSS